MASLVSKTLNDTDSEDANLDDGMAATDTKPNKLYNRHVSFNDTVQVKEFEKPSSSSEGSLSNTSDFYQTMCDGLMSMSISNSEEKNISQSNLRLTKSEDLSQTTCDADMSISKFGSDETKENMTGKCQRAQLATKGTPLYFIQPNPEQFRDPFGQRKQMTQQQEKFTYGKFGSARTPRRNDNNCPAASEILESPLIPAPTTGFLDLKSKLNTYSSDASVDIYEKWGFLSKAVDKLSRLTDYEWDEILKSREIRQFLGEIYIKAVNVKRSRLNDPDPLFRGAMKRLAEQSIR